MDESTIIALDASQNIYVAGLFKGSADFDPGPDAANLTSGGKDDAFIARFTAATTATHEVPHWEARIYPVPATDVLNIALPGHTGAVHCAVFDPAGRMVAERQGEGELVTLDLSGLESGMYYLRVRTAEGVKGMGVEVVR